MANIICKNCRAPIDENETACPYCGISTGKKKEVKVEEVSTEEISTKKVNDEIYCPSCGSSNIHFISKEGLTRFNVFAAICGFCFLGPFGLLFGLLGRKKSNTVRKCMKCGKEF